jgi:hypothetical protein
LKKVSFTFLAALLLFFAPIEFAQEHADETPECNPARPTVSTPATLTPAGYLQFENGGIHASDSAGLASQSSVNQVTKLTVNARFQFLALFEPYAYSAISGEHRGSDAGGISAGIQGVLLHGEGKRPTVSASYIRLLYAGTAPDLDIGTAKNTAILLLSTDAAGFHFDLNGLASEQSDAGLRRAQFGQTLAISHPVGKVTIAGELWHFTQPLTGGNAVGNLWSASYALKKNLVLDAGFDHGLTSTSTQWEGFAGFTYLLPHRLWRAR